MKLVKIILGLVFGLGTYGAHATVWWPEVAPVSSKVTVYRDYENNNLYYYVPRQIMIAQHPETNAKMINHGLFFNRLNPSASTTIYNLTLEAQLDDKDVRDATVELQRQHGKNARLVPLPITNVSFSVTGKYGQAEKEAQISAPFLVDVPNWTGDMHSFNQRFSVVMKSNAFMGEPAMSRFMMNKAGNAFVGTLHYGFRGVHIPFEGHIVVNIHQFLSSLKTHLSYSGFWAAVDIKAAIDKIRDNQNAIIEVKKDEGYESKVWDALTTKMVETFFEKLPTLPKQLDGNAKGGLFKMKVEYASVEKDRTFRIDLKDQVVRNHAGDIDVVGGGVDITQLDQNIKFVCDMWGKFSKEEGRCVDMCEPGIEVYNPATKSCQPAFGSSEN